MTYDVTKLASELRTNHEKIHFFGLGFIQVKVSDSTRYHFYHPELESIVGDEEVHNHRYDFRSMVLKGVLKQKIFSADLRDGLGWEVSAVSCDPLKKVPHSRSFTSRCGPKEVLLVETGAGQEYEIYKDTFHKILKMDEPVITCVIRGDITEEFASVLRPVGAEEVCPFSPNMSTDELWSWVDKVCKS